MISVHKIMKVMGKMNTELFPYPACLSCSVLMKLLGVWFKSWEKALGILRCIAKGGCGGRFESMGNKSTQRHQGRRQGCTFQYLSPNKMPLKYPNRDILVFLHF